MMKKVLFVVMAAAMLFSCHKEETNDCGCDVETGIPTKIYINGETGCESVKVRSTDGRINFEGGYATGAGIYDGDKKPTVEAHPNEGYEVDYFYGGPADNEKKYDYSAAGATSFVVNLENKDHFFKCKFKKVEKKYKLTVTSTTHGTVEGSGNYKAGETVTIKATPMPGYVFIGWVETEVAGKNYYSAVSQEATTKISITEESRTVKAIFRPKTVNLTLSFKGWFDQGNINSRYTFDLKSDCTDPDEEPTYLEIYVYDNNNEEYDILTFGENYIYLKDDEDGRYPREFNLYVGDTEFDYGESGLSSCGTRYSDMNTSVNCLGVTYKFKSTSFIP